jgi:hypothetical protein
VAESAVVPGNREADEPDELRHADGPERVGVEEIHIYRRHA